LTIKNVTLISIILLLTLVGLSPLLAMLIQSIRTEDGFSFNAYESVLQSKNEWTLLRNSISLGCMTTILSLIIGLPLGVLFAKSDLPFRNIFTLIFIFPFLLPPYILAISWFHIFGRTGLIASLFGTNIAEITSDGLFGLSGCVLILFTTFMPVVMLLTITFIKTVNPRLEQAGILNAGWFQVLKHITFPLILPGILLAGLLVFLLTIGEFSVPNYLRFNVYPVETFTEFSAFYNFRKATATVIPLAIIIMIALLLERAFLRKKTIQVTMIADPEHSLTIPLGPWKNILLIAIGLLCFLLVLLPILILIFQTLPMTTWKESLQIGSGSLIRSIVYSVLGATFLVFFGFFCGYLIHNRTFRIWQSVDTATIFLFALPGTLIGMGLILLWNTPYTNFIYATPIIILLGYIAKYTALSSRITVSTLSQISPSMEQAAQMVGAGWFRRIGCIIVPMAKRGIIAAWLIGYIVCMKDMGISMLVYPPGMDTLPVRTFTMMANGPPNIIAALCLLMVMITLIPFILLVIVYKNRV